MAHILIGPLLRYVSRTSATIWVETDAPCEVRVLDTVTSTFSVWGHHYALAIVTGLEPGTCIPYTVHLDGAQRWPDDTSTFPASAIRTLGGDESIRVLFGSCRAAAPHEPPFDLEPVDDERGIGVDALRAHGLRMLGQPIDQWPDLVMLLGDQVYADDPSPLTELRIDSERGDDDGDSVDAEPPSDLVADFEEYTMLYRESWTAEVERWLLSVVPSAMIFDDHDMIDDWNISKAWVDDTRAEPWWEEHIVGGLVSYWIYQHLGNLSPEQIEHEGILDRLIDSDDAGAVLRRWALKSEEFTPVPGGYPFSYSRHLGGGVHLVVMDSRNGRVLTPGSRSMLDDDEWAFVAAECREPCRHLMIATSLPMFVPGGLHGIQQWNEAVCDGAWGRPFAWLGEKLRRALDMEDWAAFDRSFRLMEDLIAEVATGDDAPATVSILGGDIHFSYAAALAFRNADPLTSGVYQLVCSPIRNILAPKERRVLRFAASRPGRWLAEHLQRWVKRPPSRFSWELEDEPLFANTMGSLQFEGDQATVHLERACHSDDGVEQLELVIDRRLDRNG
jgi:hypothetical protein